MSRLCPATPLRAEKPLCFSCHQVVNPPQGVTEHTSSHYVTILPVDGNRLPVTGALASRYQIPPGNHEAFVNSDTGSSRHPCGGAWMASPPEKSPCSLCSAAMIAADYTGADTMTGQSRQGSGAVAPAVADIPFRIDPDASHPHTMYYPVSTQYRPGRTAA